MKDHTYGSSAQTINVRACTAHMFDEEGDINLLCRGFEVVLERKCVVGSWSGAPGTARPFPLLVELQIRRITSRWKAMDTPAVGNRKIETVPAGPTFTVAAFEAYALLHALQRAINLAHEQGLIESKEGRSETTEERKKGETTDTREPAPSVELMENAETANTREPASMVEPTEDELFAELADRNGLASPKQDWGHIDPWS